MIDTFALALAHGLMLIAAWRLVSRADLDREEEAEPMADKVGWHGATRGAAPDA
jgi:hypothetical protein